MISVKLRNLRHQDKEAVIAMLGDPQVMRFLGPRRALTEGEADAWFGNALVNPDRFAIADAESDEFIGFCGVKQIDGVLDFGYFIRSEFWGNGIAAKACELAVERLSSEIDLETVQVFIADDNVASQKVAQKLGWQATYNDSNDGYDGRYYRVTLQSGVNPTPKAYDSN
ncbi:GNAT family N-acetyltransferase [Oceanimonas baumannii]|uniref:GNAT family N-acetyltransferase n=1 Tax=Oceanimonas baumannii TaxID=129578 RepID=UPI001D183755|nr:GNAT family N-acetyltransferase [Oceanimonas baumannii]MCC4263057.1 GNAT family N-acetyltransferase [Oceanimonas baumannii]